MAKIGRPKKIGPAQQEVLRRIVLEKPALTLSQIVMELQDKTGVQAHEATIRRALREAGVRRDRRRGGRRRVSRPELRLRIGNEMARDLGPDQPPLTGLSDSEWERVADLFENAGGPGKPPRVPRRFMLDACCYVMRTGCSWRTLPREYPSWDNVYKTFQRWSRQGKFDQMRDRLRAAKAVRH